MTNGEIIQKVFNCEVCEPIIEDDIIHVIFADKKDSAIGFDWSWWDAEYKEPTTRISDLHEGKSSMHETEMGIFRFTVLWLCGWVLGKCVAYLLGRRH